jgi:TonB family protein
MRNASTFGYMKTRIALLAACGALLGCSDGANLLDRLRGGPVVPDSLPLLLNDSLPFKYPVALYMQLISDSVTLRLYVDEFGRPVTDSTTVARSAGHAAFDSAAVEGAKALRFRPAYARGRPIPYAVLFPIQFQIPQVPLNTSPPSDSISGDTASSPGGI